MMWFEVNAGKDYVVSIVLIAGFYYKNTCFAEEIPRFIRFVLNPEHHSMFLVAVWARLSFPHRLCYS